MRSPSSAPLQKQQTPPPGPARYRIVSSNLLSQIFIKLDSSYFDFVRNFIEFCLLAFIRFSVRPRGRLKRQQTVKKKRTDRRIDIHIRYFRGDSGTSEKPKERAANTRVFVSNAFRNGETTAADEKRKRTRAFKKSED